MLLPGVRLACVGHATLVSLAGFTFSRGMPPAVSAVFGIGGIGLCAVVLVVLTPVWVGGSWGDRSLAALLALFPALWLAFEALGLGMRP